MRHPQQAALGTIFSVAEWIGVAHVLIGVCILIEPTAILVTSLAGLNWVMAIYSEGNSLGGLLLITAGALAIAGGDRRSNLPDHIRVKLIAPQVVLLVFTVASVIAAMAQGHYPDGYYPTGGWAFILADQAVAALVSLLHVISILALPLRKEAYA